MMTFNEATLSEHTDDGINTFAANDNVQNHTQVTEVVELVSLPIRCIRNFHISRTL